MRVKYFILWVILGTGFSGIEGRSFGLGRRRRSIILARGNEEVRIHRGKKISIHEGENSKNPIEAEQSLGLQKNSFGAKRSLSLQKNPIESVMIVTKHRRDFEYLSGVIHALRGGTYAPNRVADGKEQRYIIRGSGEGGEEKLSGVYAVVVLGESLRNWMGHATLTLEYLRCGSLKRQILCIPLDARDVADDRQIFIFLDPSPKNKRKFLAWKVTIDDNKRSIQHTKASLSWEIFVKNR
ncbi:MAG: hypothetical protein LBG09_00690 [Puniceicoccales bacterium]|jgi:hypothetical protein|nr:hypothetical protein [Puniceicoccales bacterium]